MKNYLILFIPLAILIFYGIIAYIVAKNNSYTIDDWNKQCKEDFKKYGPVPDNED